MEKPYDEQSKEERLAALDKIQNLLLSPEWQELYLRWMSDLSYFQRTMNDAKSWEEFVDARGVKKYIQACLLDLRETIKSEKEELEAEMAAGDQTLPPTEYEAE